MLIFFLPQVETSEILTLFRPKIKKKLSFILITLIAHVVIHNLEAETQPFEGERSQKMKQVAYQIDFKRENYKIYSPQIK